MICQCGQDLQGCEIKKGISKKNNKPWQGIKCPSCETMNWIPFGHGQDRPKPTTEQKTDFNMQSANNSRLETLTKLVNAQLAISNEIKTKLLQIEKIIQKMDVKAVDGTFEPIAPTTPEEIAWEE